MMRLGLHWHHLHPQSSVLDHGQDEPMEVDEEEASQASVSGNDQKHCCR